MYSALLLLFSFFRTCFHARSILSLLLPWMAFGDTAAITRNRSSATRCWLSVEIRACIIIYCELKSAEAIGSGGPSPTFWPLWAAPIFGPPTFDSRGPRQSVKDTHNYSFTSWIPGKTWKNPTRWLLWHSNITKFNFGPGPPKRSLRRSLRPPIVGWGGGYSLHIPHLHRPLASMIGAEGTERDWSAHFSDASAAYVSEETHKIYARVHQSAT